MRVAGVTGSGIQNLGLLMVASLGTRKPATMGGLLVWGGGCASQRQREEPLNSRGRLPLPGINAPHQCIALRADHSPDPARCVAMVNPQRGGWPERSMNSGLGAAYLTLPVSPGKEPLERLATEAMDSVMMG